MSGRKRKKLFGKSAPASGEMGLNITAMADIFTILLVFLLKSFNTGSVTLNPAKGLLLPEAQAGMTNVEALKIEISGSSILLEGTPVIDLDQRKIPRGELTKSGGSRSLIEALRKERKRQALIAQANPDVKPTSAIMIVADKGTPYATLKGALASAAVNGFTDFKLATVRKD